jgi:hypothetical protein
MQASFEEFPLGQLMAAGLPTHQLYLFATMGRPQLTSEPLGRGAARGAGVQVEQSSGQHPWTCTPVQWKQRPTHALSCAPLAALRPPQAC